MSAIVGIIVVAFSLILLFMIFGTVYEIGRQNGQAEAYDIIYEDIMQLYKEMSES